MRKCPLQFYYLKKNIFKKIKNFMKQIFIWFYNILKKIYYYFIGMLQWYHFEIRDKKNKLIYACSTISAHIAICCTSNGPWYRLAIYLMHIRNLECDKNQCTCSVTSRQLHNAAITMPSQYFMKTWRDGFILFLSGKFTLDLI